MLPRVWAPRAGRVDLVLPVSGGTRPMTAQGGGWWAGAEDLPHGTDYAFALDGGPWRPDPRTAWQPHGVHAPSRVFDAARFPWSDAGWVGLDVRGHVTYELHVGTFTAGGTLDAAAARLPDLVHLGVDLVELMPLAAFDGERGWGYDGVAPWSVHEAYGGPAALQRFVDAAHGLGLGVCLDVVHNHLGPSGNYLREFGPYFTSAHRTPWGDAVNLDGEGSDEVRRWICDSALRWLRDFHVDALRLDAVHALRDDSVPHLLAQLSDEVAALAHGLGRPLSLVAESDLNDLVSVAPTAEGGWGMTAQWADDVHHALHALLTGERHGYYADFGPVPVLRDALTRGFHLDGRYSVSRGGPWGRPVPPGTDGHRLVVCAQNHDQVGNRAAGDRPSAVLDAATLAAEAALVLLSPFTPLLFMGEEWGTRRPFPYVTDHRDPALAQAVREGRVAEFAHLDDVDVPDPQAPETFASAVLDRSEVTGDHARLLEWYRSLLALRRDVPDLAAGDLSATRLEWQGPDAVDGPWRGVLVLHRGAAVLVANLTDGEASVALPDAPLDLALAWGSCAVEAMPPRVVVGPDGVAVLVPAA